MAMCLLNKGKIVRILCDLPPVIIAQQNGNHFWAYAHLNFQVIVNAIAPMTVTIALKGDENPLTLHRKNLKYYNFT